MSGVDRFSAPAVSRRTFLAAIPAVVALPAALARAETALTVLDVRDLPWGGSRTFLVFRHQMVVERRNVRRITGVEP